MLTPNKKVSVDREYLTSSTNLFLFLINTWIEVEVETKLGKIMNLQMTHPGLLWSADNAQQWVGKVI